jgi:hypothetical protein
MIQKKTKTLCHEIDLKLTQLPGGQLSEVSGFAVSPEDIVQVKQGENLIVSTSPDLRTHQVTAGNVQGMSIDLVPLPNNVWSLQGLIPGKYTLDVIVDVSSSGILGTFETFLVVLAPNQQPLPPTTVINQITIQPRPSNGCPGNLTLIDGECRKPSRPSPSPLPPCDPNEQVSGQECICPEGTTGTPPDCEPINCDVEDPPPECVPTECPDGRIMPPGEPCPEDALPCDVPDPPEGCSVPTECPDGSIIPPGEQCPDENPPDENPPDEDPPENGNGNDDDNGASVNGDGEDGSNGGGDGNENGEDIPTVPLG